MEQQFTGYSGMSRSRLEGFRKFLPFSRNGFLTARSVTQQIAVANHAGLGYIGDGTTSGYLGLAYPAL